MKKPLTIIAAMLFCAIAADAQYIMKVNTIDGKSVQYNVSDISSITWESVDVPQYEYVDLGLNIRWATFNVGATKPEEYGEYFAWGETAPKTYYYWSTYKYCKGSEYTITKYCNNSSYGYNDYTDGKKVLDLEDDAAYVNWGGDWRMPTKAEQDELCDKSNCTWIWTTINGVEGWKVVSKKSDYEGNWIFLPEAGKRHETSLENVGIGCYWSSSLSTDYPFYAYYMEFCDQSWYENYRFDGLSVRPVCP